MIKLIRDNSTNRQQTAVDSVKNTFLLKKCEKYFKPLNYDSLELSPSAKLQIQSDRIFSRSKKFSINDYNSLSKLEKKVLRSATSSVEQDAKKSLKMGLVVKNHLDKKYGNGNYVFVCIGTSPSGVARVLEFMGVETKYLPISALNSCYDDDFYKTFYGETGEYKKFLEEQGISQKNIENSPKTYLFFDYTLSGRSLKIFENMVRECFGITAENVKFKSFDYECYSASAKKIDPAKYAVDYINHYVRSEKIANFGGVPHLPIWDIASINECKKYESSESKKFNFCLIDELSKKGLVKENPKNKNSL